MTIDMLYDNAFISFVQIIVFKIMGITKTPVTLVTVALY